METPQELSEIPQKLQSVEGFPNINWVGFRYIYILFVSRFFGSVSSFFWVSFRFSKKVLNPQFVDRFPLFLNLFPLFWGQFPVFRKSFKLSAC